MLCFVYGSRGVTLSVFSITAFIYKISPNFHTICAPRSPKFRHAALSQSTSQAFGDEKTEVKLVGTFKSIIKRCIYITTISATTQQIEINVAHGQMQWIKKRSPSFSASQVCAPKKSVCVCGNNFFKRHKSNRHRTTNHSRLNVNLLHYFIYSIYQYIHSFHGGNKPTSRFAFWASRR